MSSTIPRQLSKLLPNLNVGLTHANFKGSTSGYTLLAGNGPIVTWPHDGNYYQFWTDGTTDGRFTITNVRPGTYTLHAFANGVLGEYAKADITVEAGKKIDLGKLDWQPVRYGKQIWEIGYPDRTGDKFFKGDADNYWLWGWGLRYAAFSPTTSPTPSARVTTTRTGSSRKSRTPPPRRGSIPPPRTPTTSALAGCHPATAKDPWPQWGQGRATTWTVKFNMPKASHGTAVLRVSLAGADGGGNRALVAWRRRGGVQRRGEPIRRPSPGSARRRLSYVGSDAQGGLAIGVNGQTVGTIHPVATNALRYNTNKGVWYQYIQKFDATLLKPGANEMTFTVPAGDVTTGVVWDYLRLELNDGSKAYPLPRQSKARLSDSARLAEKLLVPYWVELFCSKL